MFCYTFKVKYPLIGVQNINVTRAYNFGILLCMLYKNVYAFITDSYTQSFSH